MTEFEATYGFNVRRFLKQKIEAETPEEAERIARERAREWIEAELLAIENGDGFGTVDKLEPILFLDATDPQLAMDPVVDGEPLVIPELDLG